MARESRLSRSIAAIGILGPVIGVAAFSGIINILGFTGPLFMLEVYDRVIPSGSLPTLVALIILVVGLFVFAGFLEILRGRMLSRIAGLVDISLSRQVLRVIAGASLRTRITGDILKPAQEMDQIRAFLGGGGSTALFDLPWIPVYLAVCFLLHPLIGWLATAAMLTLIGLTIATDLLTRSRTKEAAASASARNRFGEATHRNAEAIAAMGMLAEVQQRWANSHSSFTSFQRRSSDVASMFASASKAVRQAVQSGSLALGAYLVIQGDMSGGMIIAASIIVARALQPIEQVIANWRNMVAARQAWKRLRDLFKLFPETAERTLLPAPTKSLSVETVFAAPPGERQRMTVQNVTFRVSAGTVVGIVGPSASGKTSLVRAITGVWALTRGRISLDGAGLDQWPAHERGRHIGYMPQSSDLFPGTIAENIGRLASDAKDESIIAAARAAGVHDMIVALPDGYETEVGEGGVNLSTGQRQRVALARALYGDPFLVVLDEPNSNLDTDGDKALAEAIGAVKERGGIVIVVAHRNSVLSQLDLLLVMENGVAKAFGPRDEVLKSIQQHRPRPRTTPGPNLTVIESEAQP
ncbi:MAG: type I secretion system permease/ATPase [Pseudorhizobium sp.]